MNDAIAEFNNLLAQKNKEQTPVQTAFAIVKEVDWDARTLTATGVLDNLDYYNVLCGIGEVYTKPKIGTKCLIGSINNQETNSFLIWCEDAEEVHNTVGDASLVMKDDGFVMKVDNESMKTVLNDLIDELNKIVVVVGTTINVPAMEAIKQRLNKILIE